MTKLRKKALIFFVIFIQSTLLIFGGTIALHLVYGNSIEKNVYVYDTDIGGMSKEEAKEKLKNSLGKALENSIITIKVDEDYEYNLSCSDIEMTPDYNAIINKAFGKNSLDHLMKFGVLRFNSKKNKVITPLFKFNEKKLRERFEELSILVEKEPIDTKVFTRGGKVVKIPGSNGLRLNIDNSIEKFKDEIGKSPDFIIQFSSSNNFEIEVIPPALTMEDLKDIEDVVAEYSTRIKSKDNLRSILFASYAIHKKIVKPFSESSNKDEDLFSFNKCLEELGVLKEENDEGYNQVASSLYAAVLKADMDTKYITRTKHESYVDYIDPGIDVKVLGKVTDFRFANTSKNKIMIHTEVCNDRVFVRILGKKEDKKKTIEIKTEVSQVFEPSIINLEDVSLKPGEKKVISPGKKGLKIQVYKITYEDGIKAKKELLYTDTYKAVKSIVQIGPDTGWTGTNKIDK